METLDISENVRRARSNLTTTRNRIGNSSELFVIDKDVRRPLSKSTTMAFLATVNGPHIALPMNWNKVSEYIR
jgi:hypothetical protein